VRVDILERLADLIRPAIAYRPGVTPGTPPSGTADKDTFVVSGAMTSLAGCSGESFGSILRSLGYVMESRPGPAITVPLVPAAAREPAVATTSNSAEDLAEAASAEASSRSVEPSQVSITSDDSFLPLGIGDDVQEVPETAEEKEPESAGTASDETSPADVTSVGEEAKETGVQPTAVEESTTLAALGEAPVAPEGAEASVEAFVDQATSPQSTSLQSTDSSTPKASAGSVSEPAAAAPTEEAPAAPPMIEVWRVGRQQFHRRPERPQKRQPRVFNITPRPAKEGANGEQRFRRHQRQDQPRPQGEPASVVEMGAVERPAPAPDNRPRFKGKDDRRRNDRHEDRRSARPSTFSTETRGRDRAPDPDSPFAKLAALKAELEKNKKG
jgi:ATP-dependent RNA helicase SUPV3L1/SUV3